MWKHGQFETAACFARRRKRCFLDVAIVGMVLLAGCLPATKTKTFTPVDYCGRATEPGMARLMIKIDYQGHPGQKKYWGYERRFSHSDIRIFDNDQPIGDLGGRGQLCWDRYPGRAMITGKHVTPRPRPIHALRLDTEAGKTYLLYADVVEDSIAASHVDIYVADH
jgi:hypothetical protein